MPGHPPQSNESARPKQQLPTSTQTRLKTPNHTGWQSRVPIYTNETRNFVITRYLTDNYTIRPKDRRQEANNIET